MTSDMASLGFSTSVGSSECLPDPPFKTYRDLPPAHPPPHLSSPNKTVPPLLPHGTPTGSLSSCSRPGPGTGSLPAYLSTSSPAAPLPTCCISSTPVTCAKSKHEVHSRGDFRNSSALCLIRSSPELPTRPFRPRLKCHLPVEASPYSPPQCSPLTPPSAITCLYCSPKAQLPSIFLVQLLSPVGARGD